MKEDRALVVVVAAAIAAVVIRGVLWVWEMFCSAVFLLIALVAFIAAIGGQRTRVDVFWVAIFAAVSIPVTLIGNLIELVTGEFPEGLVTVMLPVFDRAFEFESLRFYF